ncbi:uncharacterized protein LOC135689924 isoform X1 [Rhopilema esculentum]|uniref:uncharacterized protein LOC135689924 isoform X1 n=1 Tax=Rhopilema esculentum TaxID=499914 RepID=UPI0031CEEF5A
MNFANFGLLIHGVFVINLASSTKSQVCNIADASRVNCGWHGINEATCTTRNGCCFKRSSASGFPWCFYNSNISAILKSVSVCEHAGPASLVCNNNQRVDVHDAFYGRNRDDAACHNSGTVTCFNPNATEIVRSICKINSTCTVSPKGSIWNFDSSCDMLNAQLKIHFFCVAKGQMSSTQIHASSTPHHASPTKNHLSTSLYSPTLVKPSVRQSSEGSTMQTAKTTARSLGSVTTKTVLESSINASSSLATSYFATNFITSIYRAFFSPSIILTSRIAPSSSYLMETTSLKPMESGSGSMYTSSTEVEQSTSEELSVSTTTTPTDWETPTQSWVFEMLTSIAEVQGSSFPTDALRMSSTSSLPSSLTTVTDYPTSYSFPEMSTFSVASRNSAKHLSSPDFYMSSVFASSSKFIYISRLRAHSSAATATSAAVAPSTNANAVVATTSLHASPHRSSSPTASQSSRVALLSVRATESQPSTKQTATIPQKNWIEGSFCVRRMSTLCGGSRGTHTCMYVCMYVYIYIS